MLKNNAITIMGMSGVGKTTLSDKLQKDKWFHYSGDYRIATHYLNDEIGDMLKRQAMQVPMLASLLKSDSIYIGSNLTVDNLAPVSAYIGKLGNPQQGGLDLETFLSRQRHHLKAEKAAIYDVEYFMDKAKNIYGYDWFVHDAGGSICEIDDDAAIAFLAEKTTLVYIRADEHLSEEITKRALAYPKPLYYHEAFLLSQLEIYGQQTGVTMIEQMNPDEFIRFIIPRLLKHRSERYQAIAEAHGVILNADEVFHVKTDEDLLQLIEREMN